MRLATVSMRRGPGVATSAMAAALLIWGCSSSATDPGGGPEDPPENRSPVAAAGPDLAVSVGLSVSLDGGGSSDPDGDAITYAWTLTPPAGSAATLSGAATATPSFVPDLEGAYTLSLKVNDGEAESAADQATVTAADNTAKESVPAATGGTVASTDGAMTLTVPAGALAADTEISATVVSEVQLPAAIAAIPGDLTAYDLGPDGTMFSTPVQVAVDVPGAVTSSPSSATMTGSLLYAESGGTVEPMADVLMVQDDADPTRASIAGGMSHFSHAIFVNSSMEFRIDAPAQVEAGVPFDVTFTVDITGAGLGGVGSATVEDASVGDVAPGEGFTAALSGTASVVSVTNSYTCSTIGEARIRAFMQFEATDDYGSVVRIQLGKPLTCVEATLPLVTTYLPEVWDVKRLLPIPGSDIEITTGGLIRTVNLDTRAVTALSEPTADDPEWLVALSDGTYLYYPETGYKMLWYDPVGDSLTLRNSVMYHGPRHVMPVNEDQFVLASAFGDLGLVTYTGGGTFQDAFRDLNSSTNPQQSPLTNLQTIWASPDARTFIGAVTEGDGDAAFNRTQAAIIDANVVTAEVTVTPLYDIIDFVIDTERRHDFDIDCGALEGGSPNELLCVFTSGFASPVAAPPGFLEGDGYVVIFVVDTVAKTAEWLDWTYGPAYVGANVFPYDGTTTAVAVANQATGDIDVWHVQGGAVTASFSVPLDDQCEAPRDLILIGFGARGALACQLTAIPYGAMLVIENLDVQRPPAP